MLVNTKARIGVFSIALGAYLPQFPSLVPEFEAQYDAFKKTIPDTVEIIDGGIVTTKELSQAAGDKFRAADVDLVIMQLLTYATSYNMLPAVRDLDVPVVLVVDAKSAAYSIAALLSGFLHFREDVRIAGVIFNKVGSQRHQEMLQQVCDDLQVECFGFLPKHPELEQGSRYLGLDFSEDTKNDTLVKLLEENVRWERLLKL